jgi:hypothetical protein
MRTSEQLDKIAAALLAFQKEITPPTKNKENPYFKSTYADLCSLFEHCKPAMLKHGLIFTSVGMTSRLLHTSGQWIEGEFACEVHGLSAQQVGGAMTYGRRYNFQGLLGINAEDDDDGAQASNTTTQTKTAAPKMQLRKLPPNESKLHPPAESDGERVPQSVTDSQGQEGHEDAAAMEVVTLKALTKEKPDKKGVPNRGLLLVFADGTESWWNCYQKESMDRAPKLKDRKVFAKLEDKGNFKVCHEITEVSA